MSTPTLKAAPRAVIYTRVSTDEQAEHGTSLKSQLETCRKKAQQLGAVIVGHHEDAGISGGLYWEREGLQRALAIIEAGQADTLIVATMSRLSRDTADAVVIDGRIRRAGAEIVYCDAHYDNSAMGKFARHVSQGVVDLERNIISERVRMGMHKKANEGTQPARRFSPYGYHIVTVKDIMSRAYPLGTEGTYQVVEAHAAIVREIFTRYAGGASLWQVATWLQQRGIPTPRHGKAWQPSTIKNILNNPVYKGAPAFGRQFRDEDKTRPTRGLQSRYNRPADPSTWVQLEAPAIVDAATWQACNDRLKENRALLGGRPTERKYLLSGLMRCPRCGYAMRAKTSRVSDRSGKREYHYYHCIHSRSYESTHGQVCTPGQHQGKRTDDLAIKALLSWVDQPDQMELAWQSYTRRQRPVEGAGEADELRHDLRGLQARERATVEAQIAGVAAGADASVYVRMLGEIAGQKKALQARLDKLECTAVADVRPQLQSMAAVFRELVGQAREVLTAPEVPTTTKRDILTRAVQSIVPGDGGVYVHFRPIYDGKPNAATQGVNTLHNGTPFCKVLVFCSENEVRLVIEDNSAEADELAA